MHLIGLARLGKDAIVRYLQDGTPVANLALAYNYGKKNNDGNRPTQWVEGAFFGERAERLAQWLVKGQQLNVHLSDVHLENYTTNDGRSGTKMVGRVETVEFAGSAPQQGEQQPQSQAPAQNQRNAYAEQKGGARPAAGGGRPAPAPGDMDDDIPFALDATACGLRSKSSALHRARHGRGLGWLAGETTEY